MGKPTFENTMTIMAFFITAKNLRGKLVRKDRLFFVGHFLNRNTGTMKKAEIPETGLNYEVSKVEEKGLISVRCAVK